jgi:hypothetical protein
MLSHPPRPVNPPAMGMPFAGPTPDRTHRGHGSTSAGAAAVTTSPRRRPNHDTEPRTLQSVSAPLTRSAASSTGAHARLRHRHRRRGHGHGSRRASDQPQRARRPPVRVEAPQVARVSRASDPAASMVEQLPCFESAGGRGADLGVDANAAGNAAPNTASTEPACRTGVAPEGASLTPVRISDTNESHQGTMEYRAPRARGVIGFTNSKGSLG